MCDVDVGCVYDGVDVVVWMYDMVAKIGDCQIYRTVLCGNRRTADVPVWKHQGYPALATYVKCGHAAMCASRTSADSGPC